LYDFVFTKVDESTMKFLKKWIQLN
jgi:hypothetical protein